MKFHTFKKNLIKTTILAGLAGSLMVPAIAQETDGEDEARQQTVVVTGSRLQRDEFQGTAPLSLFDAGDLEVRGISTLENLADNLTAATGGDFGSRVNNGSGGQATVSLRGLGANRTLVLLNGQRLSPSNTSGYPDLSLIPVSAIGRVEVLKDGASTVYGSDAIAGVVNIITKEDFEGVELLAQRDITDEGDGDITRFGVTLGTSFDKGKFMVNAEYMNRQPIMQADREFSACPLQEANGQIFCGGSGTSYPAHVFPSTDANGFDDDLDYVVDPATGQIRQWAAATDAYNYAAVSYMVTPMEIYSMFADGEYEVFSNDTFGAVTAGLETHFAKRSSQQQMAPVGTFWFPTVPDYHPDNPFGQDVFIARRLAELERGRFFTQDADTFRMVADLNGDLTEHMSWDFSVNYGRYTDARIIEGQVNPVRADEVLCRDPASVAAGACVTDPSLIWNPFAVDTLTQEIQDYMLVTHSPVSKATKLSYQANFYGDFANPLGASDISWAAGWENRRETAAFIPDGAASIGQIYFVSGDKTEGEYRVNEFYAETRLPILEGAPFADILAIEASVRTSSYDFTGGGSTDTTNYKVGAEWAPIEDLRFRGNYATGFRAPSIGELFAPRQQSAQQYSDPCENWGASTNQNVRDNCAADGLSQTFTLSSNQAGAVTGGNPSLTPEESESFTIGAVFTPSAIEGLDLSVDYFNVEITDAIGTAGTDNIITGCYESANFSSPLCALIQGPSALLTPAAPHPSSPRRSAVGVVSGVILTNANLSTFETSGVDFAVNYSLPDYEVAGDTLSTMLSLKGTYLEKYDYLPFEGAGLVEAAGFIAEDQFTGNPAAFAEWQVNPSAGFSWGQFSGSWNARYMSGVTDINADAGDLAPSADAIWYHDLQARYDMDNIGLVFGVKNVFDEDPPYLTNNDDMNTINQSYDTAGRYFYTRLVIRN